MFFLILGLCVFVFVFWNEGKREGFDKYKLFDITFTLLGLSTLLFISFQRWFINLNIYHYNSIILRFDQTLFAALFIYLLWIAGIWSYSRHLSWSLYRLLDVFALAQVFFILPLILDLYLKTKDPYAIFLFIPYIVLYKVFLSVRDEFKVRSGMNFALITALHATLLILATRIGGRLPIAVFLLTITVLTIYFRRRIAMTKTNITTDFMEFIKNRLNKKDKELQKSESLLKAEDPYMQPGRADGNAESMDEAILEDGLKEVTDARLGLIRTARLQVKRALAFLKIGRYGICEICGKPIDKARLEVYPEATKCVEHSNS